MQKAANQFQGLMNFCTESGDAAVHLKQDYKSVQPHSVTKLRSRNCRFFWQTNIE
jgi:hypothetical protein